MAKKKENLSEDEKKHPLLLVKKKKKGGHGGGHHGGSWKIAYADFVTAMMAFFLLMWLLASLNKAQKEGISDYFKQPLKIAMLGGDSMGARTLSVVGGGKNIKRKDGQVSASNQPVNKQDTSAKVKEPGNRPDEKVSLEKLKSNILLSMSKDPALADLKDQLLMDKVSEGLRIQLIDHKERPMFQVGDSNVDPEMRKLLAKIAKLVSQMPNKISIQGHTDAHPYNNPEDLQETNWELSTERANAARRVLVEEGMPAEKVVRVTGYADTLLLNTKDPLNPENRRITIIVMNKQSENKVLRND